jgi:nitrite reductase/ring-hydroxylating ferredoxin subunit
MGARLTLDRARGRVVCPWHGLHFSLPGGESDHERYRRLKCFGATEREGHVDVE